MTDIKRRVFISWSGEPSRLVASALRDWLPQVIQNAAPFMSEEDIAKGTRGNEAIAFELREAALGIICLTRTNLEAPWILFEAGALSNSLGAKDLVCPLLIGLRKADVRPPLSQFQLTDGEEVDVRRLLQTINLSFDREFRLSDGALDRSFSMWWPELREVLSKAADLSRSGSRDAPIRSQEDMLQEVLQAIRRLEREMASKQVAGWNPLEELLHEGGHPDIAFVSGELVRHPQFGIGAIRELSGLGRDLKALIDFRDHGPKKVVVRYANLSPVKGDEGSRGSDGT